MAGSDSKLVTKNFIWRFLERTGAQFMNLVVQIVLARLVAPEVFGSIALVTVLITILQVFVDSGMGIALIQKKNADDTDFSTVFYFNILMCLALYAVVFLSAPYIAVFYKDEALTGVIRVLSLSLIISGVKNVQQAYVSRNMLFKRFFFSTLGGITFSAILGIWMAYRGFGIWALVVQYVSNAAADTIILWITVKWRPKLRFSFERLKGLFSYGWKLLFSSLLETVYQDIRQLVIGKMYTSSDLAFYNRGSQFPKVIVGNVNTSIDSVLLPTMSKSQDDKAAVKEMTRKAIKVSTYLIAPLMIGLAFVSDSLVKLLLTEKWLPCVPYLIIFCITYLFYPIHVSNLNALKAMGRSDYYLKLEIIKKILGFTVLFATIWFGPLVMCASGIVSSLLSQAINAWPNKKLLGYSLIEQYKDIVPSILLALFMGVCVFAIGAVLPFPIILTLLIQIVAGAGIYIGLSIILKIDTFYYLLDVLKSLVKGK